MQDTGGDAMRNIFVLGLEPFNLSLMRQMPGTEDVQFHELLSHQEATRPAAGRIDFQNLLALAEARLDAFEGTVDGIIWYWDFPSSALGPLLCARRGLHGPSLPAVLACEHKYLSRLAQRRAAPAVVPRFCAVDPFGDDPLSQIDLDYPFWIKPIKAHSSHLGFKIRGSRDFRAALPVIRRGIGLFGDPFDAFMSHIDPPEEMAGIGGHHCIAEDIISAGRQCTLEGYVHGGEPCIYGVVDSVREGKHRSSFQRYQYPSQLPAAVRDRMISVAGRVMRHIGYDGAPFNVEFFWNPRRDTLRLLEINGRISKSHSPLFHMVDGSAHQRVAVDLALGRAPRMPRRAGRHALAAKFMLRCYHDGVVRRAPAEDDIARLKERFPDAMLRVLVQPDQQLRHLHYQDSYSFELAELFLGARNQRELLEKYRAAVELLPFDIEIEEADQA
jgi:hypothetical protein